MASGILNAINRLLQSRQRDEYISQQREVQRLKMAQSEIEQVISMGIYFYEKDKALNLIQIDETCSTIFNRYDTPYSHRAKVISRYDKIPAATILQVLEEMEKEYKNTNIHFDSCQRRVSLKELP